MLGRRILTTSALTSLAIVAQAQQRPQPRPQRVFDTGAEGAPPPAANDQLRAMAINLNARRSQFFGRGDVNGAASLYTPDAVYVEIEPRLIVYTGRPQIAQHLQEVRNASATDLESSVVEARMVNQDTCVVSGNYQLAMSNNRRIMGHFVQTMRNVNGTWMITAHVFARPEPITMQEVNQGGG